MLQATWKGTLVDGSTDDTATPGAARTTTGCFQQIFGGSFFGDASPMLSARMTVNRHTEYMVGG